MAGLAGQQGRYAGPARIRIWSSINAVIWAWSLPRGGQNAVARTIRIPAVQPRGKLLQSLQAFVVIFIEFAVCPFLAQLGDLPREPFFDLLLPSGALF